ncbi:hypothetical protein DYB32_007637 [Aphanomyces invadans]|uniref:Uncharacterized protein n=1 Tax=Aphanomyces invadans TaxID=157072 RepID=A0A418AN58_9STRA|nr:hypothetical protein DYB32_007637 [Aphanomyces invadans]
MAKATGKKRKASRNLAAVHAANQVAEAEALLNAGSIDQGRALLEDVVAKVADAQVSQVAKYTLAMLHLCTGNPSAADTLLASIGMHYRLHECAFLSHGADLAVADPSEVARHVQVVDAPVVDAVHAHFAFKFDHITSPFWREHRYGEPDVGYFSYAFRDCTTSVPSNCVEAWIQEHLLPYVRAAFPDKADAIAHAEWWVHSRDQISGHQLHYDTDESRLTQEHSLNYPLVSTVWYIAPGQSGAPTLITDKTFGQDASVSKGYLVFPQTNRLAMFDGSLLHGVVPHFQRNDDETGHRLTLMVGFWNKDVASSAFNAKHLTANMRLPAGKSTLEWPAYLEEMPPASSPSPSKATPVPVHAIDGPLWVEISHASDGENAAVVVDSSLLVGKYFIPDLETLDADIAGLLSEPSAEDHAWLVKHVQDDDDHPRLAQILCVLHTWMRRGGEYADTAGDFVLELTAHCAAAARNLRRSKTWASLVATSLKDEHAEASTETLAAIAWNVLKRPSLNPNYTDWFHTDDMVEALMAAAERDDDCVGMVCGALAYCLDFVPNRKWVVEGLCAALKQLYEDQEADDDFNGHLDIQDTEDAIVAVLRGSSSDRKKLVAALKTCLQPYYKGDVRAKLQGAK